MLQQPQQTTSANFYEPLTEVRLTGDFFIDCTDIPADPTEVVVYVISPLGVQTSYSYAAGDVVRDGVGKYHYDLLTSDAGTWLYKWQGLGAIVVMSRDVKLVVRKSSFILATTIVPNSGILTYTGHAPTITL